MIKTINIIIDKIIKQHNIVLSNQNYYVQQTKNPEHGDYTTNVALINKINTDIIEKELSKLSFIKEVKILNGFINMFVKDFFFIDHLNNLFQKNFFFLPSAEILAHCHTGIGGEYNKGIKNINVEYGSVNPTGPMHVGHPRGMIIGNALANMLKTNNNIVAREYYVNDIGNQIYTLLRSVYCEALGTAEKTETCFVDDKTLTQFIESRPNIDIEISKNVYINSLQEDSYKGQYIVDLANKNQEFIKKLSLKDFYKKKRSEIVNDIFQSHMNIVKNFRIDYDYITYESSVIQYRNDVMFFLVRCGVIVVEGKSLTEWDDSIEGKVLIKIDGDEEDRVLRRENKTWTYFANDICLHWLKIKRGASRLISILGEDHVGYINRLRSAIKLLNPFIQLDFLTFSVVSLKKNNQILKLSKREGNTIPVSALSDVIGYDGLKFIILMYNKDKSIEIDIDLIQKDWQNNPLTYIHYCYTRINSVYKVFKKHYDLSEKEILEIFQSSPLAELSFFEKEVVKKICHLEQTWETSIKNLCPSMLAQYLYELARLFHSWWTHGKSTESMKIVGSDKVFSAQRILMVLTVKNIIEFVLSQFNIDLTTEL